uniref:ABC transmembrane type-1 domain-containing protein n=1 Tax=Ascaris lumbricoides TaxID=6252 RepID=A0A0M3I9T3_ASCLU
MLPFFWRGFHKQLEEEDLCEPLQNHRSQVATERLTREWEREKRLASEAGRKPSLAAAVRRIYFKPVALLGILLFIEEAVKLLQPLAMGRLIRYFRYDAPLTLTEAYLAAGGVAITSAMVAFIHHPYFYGLQKQGMELKVATCGMIMQKGLRLSSAALHKTTVGHIVTLMSNDVAKFDMGLRLSSAALHKTTVGHIVTLMSNDVAKFDMAFLFVHFLWLSPLILISYTYMLWQEIGVSSLAGFGALLILVPIQGYFSRMMGKCRRQIASRTDKRVSVMNEILNGIRVIKMYAWENAFARVVDDLNIRENELVKVKANSVWQSLVMGTFWASGKMIILFAITCFILTGNQLTAERIFVAMALYNACRLPVTLFVPFALQFLFESNVSLRRVQAFLELEEYEQLEESSTIQNGHIFSKYADGSDSDEKVGAREAN